MNQCETFESGRPRARRFQLQLPVFYRSRGDAEWRLGTTTNISRTGILVQVQDVPGSSSRWDFRLQLQETSAEIAWTGSIVRREEGAESFSIAATIGSAVFKRLQKAASA